MEAITQDSNDILYAGGSINKNTVDQTAILVSIGQARGFYFWRKLYKTDGMVTITALAIN